MFSGRCSEPFARPTFHNAAASSRNGMGEFSSWHYRSSRCFSSPVTSSIQSPPVDCERIIEKDRSRKEKLKLKTKRIKQLLKWSYVLANMQQNHPPWPTPKVVIGRIIKTSKAKSL
jgi:hypothetical protein